jgi:hypothetical protein
LAKPRDGAAIVISQLAVYMYCLLIDQTEAALARGGGGGGGGGAVFKRQSVGMLGER